LIYALNPCRKNKNLEVQEFLLTPWLGVREGTLLVETPQPLLMKKL